MIDKKLDNNLRGNFLKRGGELLLFIGLTWLFYTSIFFLGTHPTALIDSLFQWFFRIIWQSVSSILIRDFLVFGLLTGLGGFLVYVPNIILLFFFSHILHESGLTARAARLLDPLFRAVGLNGYSFPPLLFGFGCSVNALHSAQNIEDKKKRLLTMLIAPFMSCGSKFAVYVLLITVVFDRSMAGTVLVGLYMLGIAVALLSAVVFRLFLGIQRDKTVVILPDAPLTRPDFLVICQRTLRDGWIFCKKAGTVIVAVSVLIWVLSYWPGISQKEYNEMLSEAEKTERAIPSRITLSFHSSYLSAFGHTIEPLFRPLGQDWKNSVAVVSSLAGRGIIISSLITMYGIEYSPEGKKILTSALLADPGVSKLSALALMLFVLLCGSCLASVTMFYHDTKSKKLTSLFIMYPIVVAWIISVFFYQIGRLIVH